MNGDAGEGSHRVRDHVVAVEMPRDLAVGLRLGHLDMADVIPRAGGNESESYDAVARPWIQRVARNLLLDEPRVRLVFVQRADDVVAGGPCVRPGVVPVVARVVA